MLQFRNCQDWRSYQSFSANSSRYEQPEGVCNSTAVHFYLSARSLRPHTVVALLVLMICSYQQERSRLSCSITATSSGLSCLVSTCGCPLSYRLLSHRIAYSSKSRPLDGSLITQTAMAAAVVEDRSLSDQWVPGQRQQQQTTQAAATDHQACKALGTS